MLNSYINIYKIRVDIVMIAQIQRANNNSKMMYLILMIISCCLLNQVVSQSLAPFLPLDTIHPTHSQFQLNLILNQNRNLPVLFIQYSKDLLKQSLLNVVRMAFQKEKGIAIALMVDCRQFTYDMNRTLGICQAFDKQKGLQDQQNDLLLPEDSRQDHFYRFDLMVPNPSRIREKGHLLSKTHDVHNLRQANYKLTQQFLAKIIRNQIPDFVVYIQDNYDMDQFLQIKSDFASSKKAKLLLFDQNLQAPLYLKKLGARLDGTISVGVTDNFKLAKKHDIFYDSILLMEYNFITKRYDTQRISINQGNQMNDILQNQSIKRYLSIKKYRDIALDFQHRTSIVYNMSTLQQINYLMTHGRLIYLQISTSQSLFQCSNLNQISNKYQVFFNYICFSKQYADLLSLNIKIDNSDNKLFVIKNSLQNIQSIYYKSSNFSAYDYLPQIAARQKVSAQSEAQMCIKTAFSSNRDPIFYWYNSRDHESTLKLLQYFNSLPQITSMIYFCQIILPSQQLIKTYQLHENCLFSMSRTSLQDSLQKFQFKQALQFIPIKMFIRELSINQMIKVYEQKLTNNKLKEIITSQQLTKQCFNQKCIIAILAMDKFRYDKEIEVLQQVKREISQLGFHFVWINGNCHWEVPKQLKLINKTQKAIQHSYIIYYTQKTNTYSLMSQDNKFWVKKDLKKWIKTLNQPGVIKSLRFGIDFQNKKCQPITNKPVNKNDQKKPRRPRRNEVKQNEL